MTNIEIEKHLREMAEWQSLWDQRNILTDAATIVADHGRAVRFANLVEWGDARFKKSCDEQLERMAKMPLGKTINESLADAVERVLKERDELKAILSNAIFTESPPKKD